MRTPDGLRTHEGSPRAILRYKSKATSFRCNTRVSIGASWRAWFVQRACTLRGTEESRNGTARQWTHATWGYLRRHRLYETRKARWSRALRSWWPSISWRSCGCRRRWPRPWRCRPATRPAGVRTIWWRAYTPIAWRRNPSAVSSTKYSRTSTRCWPTRKTSRCPRASPLWKRPAPRARVRQGWFCRSFCQSRNRANYTNLNVELFNSRKLLYFYLHLWQIYRIQRSGYAIVRSSWKIPEDAFGQSWPQG